VDVVRCITAYAAEPRAVGTASIRTRGDEGKKSDVPTYLLFLRFFEIFRSGFRKYFYGVFGLLQRNGQKTRLKKSMGKDGRKKSFFFSTFSAKSF
jgi:hypothetical protein